MTIRTVTLTAVAALSLGMAAHAQETRTITVPLTEPGAAAPVQTGPGTVVVVNPDGTTSVETTGAEPALPIDADTAADMPVSLGTPGEAPADEAPAAIQNPELPAGAATGADVSSTTEPLNTDDSSAVVVGDAPADVVAVPAVDGAVPVAVPVAVDEAPVVPAEAPAVDAAAPVAVVEAPAEVVEAPAAEPEVPAADVAATDSPTESELDFATGKTQVMLDNPEVVEPEAPAAAHEQHIEDIAFSFEGPFGTFDQFQIQRGLQVFTEVCSSCHGLKQVALRSLADPAGPGLPEDQVRAYAKEMTIFDPELDDDRERLPTDHFPTVTGEGMGPDLSLMAKARAGFHGPYGTGVNQLFKGIGGPEYIHAILTSYTGEEKEEAGKVFYENRAFPGGWIAMPPPLSDDLVEFQDGSPTDLDAEARDVATFLMWAAEPKLMARKQVGLISVIFLIVLSALLYLTNKRLWWPLKHRRDIPGDGR